MRKNGNSPATTRPGQSPQQQLESISELGEESPMRPNSSSMGDGTSSNLEPPGGSAGAEWANSRQVASSKYHGASSCVRGDHGHAWCHCGDPSHGQPPIGTNPGASSDLLWGAQSSSDRYRSTCGLDTSDSQPTAQLHSRSRWQQRLRSQRGLDGAPQSYLGASLIGATQSSTPATATASGKSREINNPGAQQQLQQGRQRLRQARQLLAQIPVGQPPMRCNRRLLTADYIRVANGISEGRDEELQACQVRKPPSSRSGLLIVSRLGFGRAGNHSNQARPKLGWARHQAPVEQQFERARQASQTSLCEARAELRHNQCTFRSMAPKQGQPGNLHPLEVAAEHKCPSADRGRQAGRARTTGADNLAVIKECRASQGCGATDSGSAKLGQSSKDEDEDGDELRDQFPLELRRPIPELVAACERPPEPEQNVVVITIESATSGRQSRPLHVSCSWSSADLTEAIRRELAHLGEARPGGLDREARSLASVCNDHLHLRPAHWRRRLNSAGSKRASSGANEWTPARRATGTPSASPKVMRVSGGQREGDSSGPEKGKCFASLQVAAVTLPRLLVLIRI